MNRCLFSSRTIAIILLGHLLSGCRAPTRQLKNPSADPLTKNMTFSELARNTDSGQTLRVIDLAFDVIQAEFPVAPIRHSQKVWNHIDELRVDAELSTRLAQNGIRVGVTTPESWPMIETVFRAGGAHLEQAQLFVLHGLPLSIQMSAVEDHESIFSYDQNHRLAGKTFSVGIKLINLDYAFHAELDGVMDIRVSFEVRHDRGIMTWERRNGIIRQVPSYDRYVFEHISIPITLLPGELLIIGPGEESLNEYLIGSRFLRGQRETRKTETLLCIKPRPYQTRRFKRNP